MNGSGAGVEYYAIQDKTAPLVVSEGPEWFGPFGDMRRETRLILFGMRGRLHENLDTGWKVSIGRKGIDKALSEANSAAHFHALKELSALIRNAILVKRSGDRKERKNVRAYYRLYAPIRIGDILYAAQLTVSEGAEKEKHFYLQRLEIEKPAVLRGVGGAQAHVAALRPAGHLISIPQLLRAVKSEDAPADDGEEE